MEPGLTELNPASYMMFALSLKTLDNVQSFNGGQPLTLRGSTSASSQLISFDATFQLRGHRGVWLDGTTRP